MSESDGISRPEQPPEAAHRGASGTVTLAATSYSISPTAFRLHYQVTTVDGTLLGLIEAVDIAAQKFIVRPASGAPMTQSLLEKIAQAGAKAGLIRDGETL